MCRHAWFPEHHFSASRLLPCQIKFRSLPECSFEALHVLWVTLWHRQGDMANTSMYKMAETLTKQNSVAAVYLHQWPGDCRYILLGCVLNMSHHNDDSDHCLQAMSKKSAAIKAYCQPPSPPLLPSFNPPATAFLHACPPFTNNAHKSSL